MYPCTVWKFHDFSITQILREIKFEDSRSAKSTIFTHLEALNFDFMHFCTLRSMKLTKNSKFRVSKIEEMAFLELLDSTKLISRKI